MNGNNGGLPAGVREDARLADAVYNRSEFGETSPNEENFSEDVQRDYSVTRLRDDDGDVVYGFENKRTGELTVAARGTDSLDDAGQYIGIA